MLLVVILGVLVGVVMGLTGAGGGILAMPALVVGLSLPVTEATPVTLVAVAASALVGAIEGLRRGLVRYRAATLMGVTGMAFTPLGVLLARHLPERWLLALFSLVMWIVALRTLRQAASLPEARVHALCQLNPATGQLAWRPVVVVVLAGIGAVMGFVTGLLGVGGGFVIVPALHRATNIPTQGIVATSLMVITLVAAGGVVASLWHGAHIAADVAVPFVGAAVLGVVAGRATVRRLSARSIQRAFALVVILVAIAMLTEAAIWHP
jgi:uncharacterized protein